MSTSAARHRRPSPSATGPLSPTQVAPRDAGRVIPPDFAQVYREHRDAVAAHLHGRVPESDVEDLTQEVFAKAERGLAAFRGDASLRTWLLRVATRAALDHVRSRRSREARRTEPLPESGGESGDATHATPEALRSPSDAVRQVARREMSACIREYVDRLPSAYRDVILLRDLEDRTMDEIATRLEVSPEAAKIRLHRARQALRRLLQEGCELYTTEDSNVGCDRRLASDGAEPAKPAR